MGTSFAALRVFDGQFGSVAVNAASKTSFEVAMWSGM